MKLTEVMKSDAVGDVPPTRMGQKPISNNRSLDKMASSKAYKKYVLMKLKQEKDKEKKSKLKKILNKLKREKKINEELQYVKFKYTADDINDKKPKVKVLDFEYPGRPGQKTYGKRKDILGFNLNYVSNRNEAIKNIDDMSSFGKLLNISKKDLWERFKAFYPEVATKVIRRYKRDEIKRLKYKNESKRWKKAAYDKLIELDKMGF